MGKKVALGFLLFLAVVGAVFAALELQDYLKDRKQEHAVESPEIHPASPPTAPVAAFQKFKSADVVAAFSKAGLEVAETRPMNRDDYGIAPMVAAEGTRFTIPSISTPDSRNGGRILSFATPEDLAKSKEFYDSLGKEAGLLFSHVFVKDNILVQINGDLPDEQAKQYDAALQGLS